MYESISFSQLLEIPLVSLSRSPTALRSQRPYQLMDETAEDTGSYNIALSEGYR